MAEEFDSNYGGMGALPTPLPCTAGVYIYAEVLVTTGSNSDSDAEEEAPTKKKKPPADRLVHCSLHCLFLSTQSCFLGTKLDTHDRSNLVWI